METNNYATINKEQIIEYIYKLLYLYNSTDHTNISINPYETPLTMNFDNENKIIIPEKIQKECINSWHNKEIIKSKKFKLNKIFLYDVGELIIGIVIIILFLYTLSLMRYVTKKFTF